MRATTKKTRTHWARLSVDYYRDPAILEAGPVAEVAFIRLLALARERVEAEDEDGAVSKLLAKRELREVIDLWAQVTPGGTFDSLLEVLVGVGLITVDGNKLVVANYSDWQTTRAEIERDRNATRARQQAFRDRRRQDDKSTDADDEDEVPAPARGRSKTSTKSTPGGEDEMGVYDEPVEPFTDLREAGEVKKGNRKVGKHGLSPTQVADAERVVEHLTQTRKEILGGSFRVTETWWTDVRRLLNGTAETPPFTADQVCDLIDFALSDRFWHAHCQTPAGLVKHGGKLFSSDEYVRWSKQHGRPSANRPRDTLIGDKGKPLFKGQLAADKKTDWSKVSEEL